MSENENGSSNDGQTADLSLGQEGTGDSSIGGENVDLSQISAADIENSSLTKEEKKEAKKMLREFEIKYNGKSEKVTLPFDVPEDQIEYMRKQAQMAKMATVKSQEYAGLEKDVLAFFNELRENPRKALSNPNVGIDLKKIAAEILQEELENSQKSPQQLRMEELERKLAEKEAREAELEENHKKTQREAHVERIANQFDSDMADTLERYNIPKEPYAVKKMAEYMAVEIKAGRAPDMEAIGAKVESEMSGDYKSVLKKMTIEEKIKFLGEEIFEEARKHRVSKMKKAPQSIKTQVQDVAKAAEKKTESAPKKNYKDFFGV